MCAALQAMQLALILISHNAKRVHGSMLRLGTVQDCALLAVCFRLRNITFPSSQQCLPGRDKSAVQFDLQVKEVMLDSANESISRLKECLEASRQEAAHFQSNFRLADTRLSELDPAEIDDLRYDLHSGRHAPCLGNSVRRESWLREKDTKLALLGMV